MTRFTLASNLVAALILCGWIAPSCNGFSMPSRHIRSRTTTVSKPTALSLAYVPQRDDKSSAGQVTTKEKKNLYPKVGDIVRYYDVDGGRLDGEVLVGKITYIQKEIQGKAARPGSSGWLVELMELDDIGDGYFAEYTGSKRRSKTAIRDLSQVSPIAASFVSTENAFKIPRDRTLNRPLVKAEQYDWEDYGGPFSGANSIDLTVVEADAILYGDLKGRVLKFVALTGLLGTVGTDFIKGTEDAVIYFSGVIASLLYLFLLSVKTDTMASPQSKFGSNISNLRFAMPLLVLVGIALYNKSLGDANPVLNKGVFDYVTTEQFAAAIIGFLTYRIPLFIIQLQDAFKTDSGGLTLPGSAGIALKLAQGQTDEGSKQEADTSLATILLVSGPQATGRPELVKRLIQEGQGRFVEPQTIDRVKDPATFERLLRRDEFLWVSQDRYGYTKDGVLASAKAAAGKESVVVVDADVAFAKKLTAVSGLRIVGVWVGLNSVEEFERRLEKKIDSGELPLPEDETRESLVRARIREIVKEVEYGISSGIFEFTILNEDEESSTKQLQEAATYCFK